MADYAYFMVEEGTADYAYYVKSYLGTSIHESEFVRIASRAKSKLAYYKRVYTVTGDSDAENMAVCAMADALYYFETAANTPQNSSVGSVSSSSGTAVDISPAAQEAELYRCASMYLEIYRG